MTELILVERFPEGGSIKRSLQGLQWIDAEPGIQYSVVDGQSMTAPQYLGLMRIGHDLQVSCKGNPLLLIKHFFEHNAEQDLGAVLPRPASASCLISPRLQG